MFKFEKPPEEYRPEFDGENEILSLHKKSKRDIADKLAGPMPVSDREELKKKYESVSKYVDAAKDRIEKILSRSQSEGNKLNAKYEELLERTRRAQEDLHKFEVEELGMQENETGEEESIEKAA